MPEIALHIQYNKVANPAEVQHQLKSLKDGFYLMKITRGKKRSNPQNAYYWGTVVPCVRHGLVDVGYREVTDNDQVHEMLKAMFLRSKVTNEFTGEQIPIAGSTAKLTTVEFNDYIDQIVQWAGEYLSIIIPLPNQSATIY